MEYKNTAMVNAQAQTSDVLILVLMEYKNTILTEAQSALIES